MCFFRIACFLVLLVFIAGDILLFRPYSEQNERAVGNHTCPDPKYECADNTTCCKIAGEKYGCCPFDKGVCCSDKLHCCPQGFTCDLSKQTCEQVGSSEGPTPWLSKTVAEAIDGVDRVQCNSYVSCPDLNTCCMLRSGDWGCCPLPNAVCCADKEHCCPNGRQCNPRTSMCESKNHTTEMVTIPGVSKNVCPDKRVCMDSETCCNTSAGVYECCPYTDAICCPDTIHCCPKHYSCDLKRKACVLNPNSTQDLLSIIKPKEFSSQQNIDEKKSDSSDVAMLTSARHKTTSHPCPDQKSFCPGEETCCMLPSSAGYGCCPFPRAVCCSDHIHCCPSGYRCDLKKAACVSKDGGDMIKDIFLSLLGGVTLTEHQSDVESPAIKINKSLSKVVSGHLCPGKKVTCPKNFPCCNMTEGMGCCPIKEGICCSDGIHCCPPQTKCDLHLQRCSKTILNDNIGSISSLKDSQCPDGSSCPDDSTCCPLPKPSKAYGCCVEKNGVCCEDGVHCCPHGQTCGKSGCNDKKGSIQPWGTKTLTIPSSPTLKEHQPQAMVICPDQKSRCPGLYTCCKTHYGYGCCPLTHATCCPDHLHCCPNGQKCIAGGQCKAGNQVQPAVRKQAATVTTIICPDRKTKCGTRETCCPIGDDKYSCCPSSQAICCADHLHCCPQGYSCDPSSGGCRVDPDTIGYIRRLFVSSSTPPVSLRHKSKPPPPPANIIVCPDQISVCPDGMTCCQTASHQYACCPEPKAVCCEDHLHCCPQGTVCDVEHQKCVGKVKSVPWKTKVSALPKGSLVQRMQMCEDGTECPEKYTCCRLKSGHYGCCPLEQAVCCDDGIHCCPNGYTCSPTECVGQQSSSSLAANVPFSTLLQSTPSNVHSFDPDDQTDDLDLATMDAPDVPATVCPNNSSCLGGGTCCRTPDGGYSCCNHTNATCCKDGLHCCKEGLTCNPKGECVEESYWLKTIISSPISQVYQGQEPFIPCKDPTVTCRMGTTCCQRTGGQYGCCPYPQAQCCSDMIHCCPHGFRCDGRRQYCVRQGGLESAVQEFVGAVTVAPPTKP